MQQCSHFAVIAFLHAKHSKEAQLQKGGSITHILLQKSRTGPVGIDSYWCNSAKETEHKGKGKGEEEPFALDTALHEQCQVFSAAIIL